MQTPNTFGPVMLTSLERVAFYLGKEIGKGRVDGINSDTPEQRRTRRSLLQWILDASSRVQNHCHREMLIQERTQYFNVDQSRMEYFPSATPILSIFSLRNDPLGLFAGGEWTLPPADYRINAGAYSFEPVFSQLMPGRNALEAVLTGGLAYHGTQSTFTVGGVESPENLATDSGAVYAYGNLSESIGRVVGYTASLVSGAGTLVVETYAGVFVPGEDLTFQTELYAQDIPSTGATITAIKKQSLCEAYPDISRAMELEIRYLEKHEMDFENQTDGGKYGATRRDPRGKDDPNWDVTDEAAARLAPYVRYLVGT